jgi:DNA-binding response OmpR family regulator
VLIIPEGKTVVHPVCSRRILYAGHDLLLLQFLQQVLADCRVVRCPNGSQARLFIEKIKYWLLVFDEELPDTSREALKEFARLLSRRGAPPIMIVQGTEDFESLARAIIRLLTAPQ